MLSCADFIVTAPAVSVGAIEICTDGMRPFLESITVVELDAPTFLLESTLDVMCALLFAIGSSINLCLTAPEAKDW